MKWAIIFYSIHMHGKSIRMKRVIVFWNSLKRFTHYLLWAYQVSRLALKVYVIWYPANKVRGNNSVTKWCKVVPPSLKYSTYQTLFVYWKSAFRSSGSPKLEKCQSLTVKRALKFLSSVALPPSMSDHNIKVLGTKHYKKNSLFSPIWVYESSITHMHGGAILGVKFEKNK